MSQQEVRELREKSDEALKQELEEAHESLFKLRFQASTRQLADNSQIKKSRRRVALLKTLMNERRAAAK
ncbi:MAG: 50S ribosomal protein L29 [Dehalococcoidia bacterium]|nr:50S ribosomal protein L29 [Dehalococcoidia bacterium]MCA9849560.1 50S ribosomal protein L29 [Dehalococcoidia bacterium]MCA9856619.1 50S ribosomal protein L29 [Dehalococcoidia bacterium]MCB1733717.1 50S ribosomal protein L29 [Gammaproteobacteria bacterium]MCB9483200.1 50S ribosomal protein L29 [Dehalococcoidia bacterium]